MRIKWDNAGHLAPYIENKWTPLFVLQGYKIHKLQQCAILFQLYKQNKSQYKPPYSRRPWEGEIIGFPGQKEQWVRRTDRKEERLGWGGLCGRLLHNMNKDIWWHGLRWWWRQRNTNASETLGDVITGFGWTWSKGCLQEWLPDSWLMYLGRPCRSMRPTMDAV